MWYLYLMFGLTIVTCIIRSLVLLTCFNFETAKFYMLKNNDQAAEDILSKMYHDEFVQSKLNELQKEVGEAKGGVSLNKLFTTLKLPMFLGMTLGIF